MITIQQVRHTVLVKQAVSPVIHISHCKRACVGTYVDVIYLTLKVLHF